MKHTRLCVTILMLVMPVAFSGCTTPQTLGENDLLVEETVDRIIKSVYISNKKNLVAQGLMRDSDTLESLSLPQVMQTSEGQTELRKQYNETSRRCDAILATLASQADMVMWIRIAVATAGAAAGGIAVPALTASAPLANVAAINALGGVSGVTNAFLGALGENSLTRGEIIGTREGLRHDYFTAMGQYDAEMAKSPPNYVGAALALEKAKRVCVNYGTNVKAVTRETSKKE